MASVAVVEFLHYFNIGDLEVMFLNELILNKELVTIAYLKHVEDDWYDEHHADHFQSLVVAKSGENTLHSHREVAPFHEPLAEDDLQSRYDDFHLMRAFYQEYNEAPNEGLLEPTEVVDGVLPVAIISLQSLEVVTTLQFLLEEQIPWNTGS